MVDDPDIGLSACCCAACVSIRGVAPASIVAAAASGEVAVDLGAVDPSCANGDPAVEVPCCCGDSDGATVDLENQPITISTVVNRKRPNAVYEQQSTDSCTYHVRFIDSAQASQRLRPIDRDAGSGP